jgi:hypothetical protein
MPKFSFSYDWVHAGAENNPQEHLHTMAQLALYVGDVNLMQNVDVWSKTISENVLVSAYPLAMWLASSWWRLNWEPIHAPAKGGSPDIDWRMTHELGAANHGFVWPKIILASDNEIMQVFAAPSRAGTQQSVRYLNGLSAPASIPLAEFRNAVEDFINGVLSRLNAMSCHNTDLANLWQLILEDRADSETENYRKLEAKMGYDPEECLDKIIEKAKNYEHQIGASTFSELAPVYGKAAQTPLFDLDELMEKSSSDYTLVGHPVDPRSKENIPPEIDGQPWKQAHIDAQSVRHAISNSKDKIKDNDLYELLGLTPSAVANITISKAAASVAIKRDSDEFAFIPRKNKNYAAIHRFEFARFLGDYLWTQQREPQWLASTDLRTSRQKYQRAFAAELLCPLDALQEFLHEDYTDVSIEKAARHFTVSEITVNSILMNNNVMSHTESDLPYRVGVS